ncbi:hypothetical protein CRM22_007301 [Opisthorchis felineus]|uniref:Uncharacterized protein n=1 Tax=Opisthorchis felineus TaxID=147828 RepID=A0A4S2LGM3_OPIFE|nr:hypothetical protein CRM22_007301 [Opisthorchis felineus]TGZ62723.1 hypothetical protein CRM22_007301 [Opisthorchis felineus]TGZ62724.1 hypothetical protein CRM22_007301 [Opisthorchis felineus]
MHTTESDARPNPERFSNIESFVDEVPLGNVPSASPSLDSKCEVYQPARLNPVFYEQPKNKALERAKKRAARFILEDPDLRESEDLPEEIHFGSYGADIKIHKKLAEKQRFEEENFTRLQVTKQEKRLHRCFFSAGFGDTSAKTDPMQILLQSSDEEGGVDYQPFPTKKKRKKLKRLRHKKNKCKGRKPRK